VDEIQNNTKKTVDQIRVINKDWIQVISNFDDVASAMRTIKYK
jgi:hypothetical protein